MLKLSVFAPILLILACAAPAGPTPSASEPTGPSGTLDVGIASDIISGDFHIAQGGGNWPMSVFVPEGLVGNSPVTGKTAPRLATEWKMLEEGRVWEFKLRQGVQFHNGEPFNAEAVKYSVDRLVDPAIKAARRAIYAPKYVRTEIIDDYTVRVVLKEPDYSVPFELAGQPMFPPKYAQSVGADGFARQPVGTGPFRLAEWRPGEIIVLEAFENYWNKDPNIAPTVPKIKAVRQRIIPEDQTRIAALQTREVAMIVNVPEQSAARLASQPGIKSQYRGADSLNMLLINMMMETDPKTGKPNPFRDRRVRQAVNYAVDVDTITKKLRTGKETRSNGQTTSSIGYDPSLKPYPYDPAKAKSLLAEAGFANGFETVIHDPTGRWPASKEVNEAIAGYLGAVGIRATVQPTEYAVVAKGLVEKQLYGMAFWGGSHGSSPWGTISLYYLRGEKSGRSAWLGPPEMDGLIGRFYRESDPEKQADMMKMMNRINFEDAADLFLYDQFYVFAYDSGKVDWDSDGPPYSSNSGQIPYHELVPVKR